MYGLLALYFGSRLPSALSNRLRRCRAAVLLPSRHLSFPARRRAPASDPSTGERARGGTSRRCPLCSSLLPAATHTHTHTHTITLNHTPPPLPTSMHCPSPPPPHMAQAAEKERAKTSLLDPTQIVWILVGVAILYYFDVRDVIAYDKRIYRCTAARLDPHRPPAGAPPKTHTPPPLAAAQNISVRCRRLLHAGAGHGRVLPRVCAKGAGPPRLRCLRAVGRPAHHGHGPHGPPAVRLLHCSKRSCSAEKMPWGQAHWHSHACACTARLPRGHQVHHRPLAGLWPLDAAARHCGIPLVAVCAHPALARLWLRRASRRQRHRNPVTNIVQRLASREGVGHPCVEDNLSSKRMIIPATSGCTCERDSPSRNAAAMPLRRPGSARTHTPPRRRLQQDTLGRRSPVSLTLGRSRQW